MLSVTIELEDADTSDSELLKKIALSDSIDSSSIWIKSSSLIWQPSWFSKLRRPTVQFIFYSEENLRPPLIIECLFWYLHFFIAFNFASQVLLKSMIASKNSLSYCSINSTFIRFKSTVFRLRTSVSSNAMIVNCLCINCFFSTQSSSSIPFVQQDPTISIIPK